MNTLEFINRLKAYIISQIDVMSASNPVIGFMKPIITRMIDKNFNRIIKPLDLIANEDGSIDIREILSEMIDKVRDSQPFTIKTAVLGNIDIGGGTVKFNLPMTDKQLLFNTEDLENFKNTLINNQL